MLVAWIVLAALLVGSRPTEQLGALSGVGGIEGVILGLCLHALILSGAGIAMAAMLSSEHAPTSSAVIGAGCGLAVMILVASFIAPAISKGAMSTFQEVGGAWVIGYLVWGVVTGYLIGRWRPVAAK